MFSPPPAGLPLRCLLFIWLSPRRVKLEPSFASFLLHTLLLSHQTIARDLFAHWQFEHLAITLSSYSSIILIQLIVRSIAIRVRLQTRCRRLVLGLGVAQAFRRPW